MIEWLEHLIGMRWLHRWFEASLRTVARFEYSLAVHPEGNECLMVTLGVIGGDERRTPSCIDMPTSYSLTGTNTYFYLSHHK